MNNYLKFLTPEWFNFTNESDRVILHIDGIVSGSYYDDNFTESSRFISELNRITAKRIELHINSPGGDVFAGFAIYNALVAWTKATPDRSLSVIIDGLAASIASVIAMAGDSIAMPAASVIMIHNPWSCTIGDAAEHQKSAEFLETLAGQICRVYSARTGLSEKFVSKLMSNETYMSADDALKNGFATELIENKAAAAACAPTAEIFGSVIPCEILKIARALQKRQAEKRQRDAGASRAQARASVANQCDAGNTAVAQEMRIIIKSLKGLLNG